MRSSRTVEEVSRFRIVFQLPPMKNRILLAIALVGIGIAILTWAIADRSTRRGEGPAVPDSAAWKAAPTDRSSVLEEQQMFATIENDYHGRVAALERPSVAGARVLADGEIVVTSDAQGVALLHLAREPARIEIGAPGWTVLGSQQLRNGRIEGDSRELVVWLAH